MMNKRILSLALTLVLVLSLFAGCSGNPQPSQGGAAPGGTDGAQTTQPGGENPSGAQTQDQDKPEETPPAERTVTVTDMSGDEVTVTGEVKRIVNLWPSASSSFIVMGAGDLLCGLGADTANAWSRFFYPNLDNIPVLGGIEPSVEDIVKLDPDLVIVHPSSGRSGYAQQLRELDIPAININFSNYETMVQAYTLLGTVLGGEYQEKLATWCAAMQEKASSHKSLTGALTEKPTVYYIAGQSESLLVTMGASANSTNIMQDWTESSGGVYGPAAIGLTGQEITAEEVFSMNPDVIIVGGVYQHVLMPQVLNSNGWKDLNAVKNGRVYGNPYACFNWDRFGMESLLQADYAFLCIQPELAADNGIDRDYMVKTIIDFYTYYNGTVLTEEQAGFMLDGLMPDGTMEIPAA